MDSYSASTNTLKTVKIVNTVPSSQTTCVINTVPLNISLQKKICIKEKTRVTSGTSRLYLRFTIGNFNRERENWCVCCRSEVGSIRWIFMKFRDYTRCQTWVFHEFTIQRRENNRAANDNCRATDSLFFLPEESLSGREGSERRARGGKGSTFNNGMHERLVEINLTTRRDAKAYKWVDTFKWRHEMHTKKMAII